MQTTAEQLSSLPLLQYLKEPVEALTDLYLRYPDGGEYGWLAFVYAEKTFAYWDIDRSAWALINACQACCPVPVTPKNTNDPA